MRTTIEPKEHGWVAVLCTGAEHLREKLRAAGVQAFISDVNYDGERRFANSDVYTRLAEVEKLSGLNVAVFQSFAPCCELDSEKFSTADRFFETMQFLEILREIRARPKSISLLALHMPFSKQDKLYKEGEVNSCRLACATLLDCGVERIVAIDPHPTAELQWVASLIEKGKLLTLGMHRDLIAGVRQEHDLSGFEFYSMPGKKRLEDYDPLPNTVKERISGNKVVIRVEMDCHLRNFLIVDDMVVSGSTILETMKALRARRAEDVRFVITHAIPYSGGRETKLLSLVAQCDKKIHVSDTVKTATFLSRFPELTVSCVPRVVQFLDQMFSNIP